MFEKITSIKTIVAIALITVFALTLSGCGKYSVDKNLTAEQEASYKNIITEYSDILAGGAIDSEKLTALQELAVAYDALGNYKKAIEYYDLILAADPVNFIALNNITVIYEEVGEIDMALNYVNLLYTYYSDQEGVVSDAIRIYLEVDNFETASQIITAYGQYLTTTEEGISESDQSFLSEKFGLIQRTEAVHNGEL
jgi:tetratricopeptide (TPR) repeat protein